MKAWSPTIGRWASAIVLAYLALFFWADSILHLVRPDTPSPLTASVAWLTLALSLRAIWRRTWRATGLSAMALAGLMGDWKPWLLLLGLPLMAAAAVLGGRRRGSATAIGRHRWLPWRVQLAIPDRLLHLHVLGPTGAGKSSSVLMPLMRQDVLAGHGVVLMEPKGDLASAVYHAALAADRSVIFFDPLTEHCPHYNPLDGPADAAAEGLSWTLNQISEGGHPYYAVSARIHLLYAVRAVKAVLGDGADIGAVLTFFRDEPTQRRWVRDAHDDAVTQYFEEQWSRKSGQSREDRQGLLNRLELLWANPVVRQVLSAPGDFTWDEVLQESWVVICPLSLAQLGESARALGSLLWHGLAQAAYRRNPAEPNPACFLYLDEFHQWVSEDLGDFLSLARGYAVGLVLAHQDMGQLTPPLQEAVVANARQRLILPGSAAEDVARFQRAAEPFSLDTPVRYLPRGQAMAHLTRRGSLIRPQIIRLYHEGLSHG